MAERKPLTPEQLEHKREYNREYMKRYRLLHPKQNLQRRREYQDIEPGTRYNSWVFLKYAGYINGEDRYYVRCDCGKECIRDARSIVTGRSKSCGCTRLVSPLGKAEKSRVYKANWFKANQNRLQLKHNEKQREQRLRDMEEYGTDRYRLKSLYGLSLEDFSEMLVLQNNRCAICGREFIYEKHNKLRPCIDHDHNTGIIRGVLCNSCNLAIGLLQDSPEVLRSAAEYLEEKSDVRKSISYDTQDRFCG